jgi:hypothetical protein
MVMFAVESTVAALRIALRINRTFYQHPREGGDPCPSTEVISPQAPSNQSGIAIFPRSFGKFDSL